MHSSRISYTSFFNSRRLHSPFRTPPRIGRGGVLRFPYVSTRLAYIKATLANPTGLRYTPAPAATGQTRLCLPGGASSKTRPSAKAYNFQKHLF